MPHRRRQTTLLERLEERNRLWRPKKVKLEQQLKKEYAEGELKQFQQPTNFTYHYLNRNTTIDTVDYLIEEMRTSSHFTIDTEDNPLTHRPSIIQIEIIRFQSSSIVILIEAEYLPPQSSPLFNKIQLLCSILSSSNNHLFAWSEPKNELQAFATYDLFRSPIQAKPINVQLRFKEWYDPTPGDAKDKYSLQFATKVMFKEYLNKEYTVAEWGCGIDGSLGTSGGARFSILGGLSPSRKKSEGAQPSKPHISSTGF